MLNLRSLGKQYGKRWILQNLELEVSAGECVALLGPSGCGKSTVLRLIAGLETPDAGRIELDGSCLSGVPAERRRIGMVFQSYALFPHLNVRENLDLGLKIRGVRESQRQQRIAAVLATVQLEDQAERRPQQLSGGQRQRVALARALLRDPSLYLLDEPMSNLDAQLRDELRPELKRLILQGPQPVLYVTHDQQEAMALADRIAVLKDGRIEQIGTPQELYHQPQSPFVAGFIGRPQINWIEGNPGFHVGVRPEHIVPDDQGMACRVVGREWLGASQMLLLESAKGTLRMLCHSGVEPSDTIHVSWSDDNEHRFERSNGSRVS